VLVGNIRLLAVDRIEVVRTVADRIAGVHRTAVDHIEVDRIAAVVGGIHLLLPYLSVLPFSVPSRVIDHSNRDTGLGRGDILVIVKLPR